MGLNDGKAKSEKLRNITLNGAQRKRPVSEGFDRAQYDLMDFGAVVPAPAKSSTYGFLSQKRVPPAPVNSPEPECSLRSPF
ncbi:hypothetical protein J2N86_04615 [Legionella lytica]|uniref:Uncharacterized protein n=1 Tax=Legionella lytica TaxID=96232 RepID=A0ABY4YAS5_9GAMM|nr:hypothetical protein [Legionella lytica]USQ14599.1 hypothetical protein J2N86_04615 [Legionella lytica]